MRMIERIGPKNPTRLYIREWMEKLTPTMTNERLAERMEIAPGTVSKLLSGTMTMTVPYLERFAEAIGLDDAAKLFHDPNRPTIDELLRGLPADEEERIVEQVKWMAEKARERAGKAA